MAGKSSSLEVLGMNAEFWSGKNVLVTGHTGFKGSWLCLMLEMAGARVSGYALAPPTEPSLFEIAKIDESLIWNYIADVRDADRLRDVVQESEPEIIFQLAAQCDGYCKASGSCQRLFVRTNHYQYHD